MKRVLVWGIFFVISCLFEIFNRPMVNNPIEIKTVKFEAIEPQKTIDAQGIMDELVKESQDEHRQGDMGITYEEAQMLMKIAMAEAESDGVEGKAMVMAVILNRVNDDRFPDSIEGVIFQEGQFSPIADGRYKKAVPDVECNLALAEIEMGEYNTVDALYFENAGSCWQSKNCIYLGTVGHHKFYKN